jgi:hypothetical protein
MARGGKREGAGRPSGALTQRTRDVAEKALATGKTPLEVMIDNMRHFQQVALDAEATLDGLSASEFSEQVSPDASPEDQFKFLLAQVKKTAGFRQIAQECARDAAPYIHPKLSSVAHTDPDGGPLKITIVRYADDKPS